MEEWQQQHITKNLAKLNDLTDFNCQIQSELVASNILCKVDIDYLDAQKNQHGKFQACKLYYEKLMTRRNSYKVLTKVLTKYNQTGAARILISVPPELYCSPLKYLGISITTERFQDGDIEVNGKFLKICEFWPTVDYLRLQSIFEETISELEFYDTFISRERRFVLACNLIPPKPPYYISRSLSSRLRLNESVFEHDCLDVFVFKNSIERHELSHIAKSHYTSSSCTQLVRITSRFIYLDDNEDWVELKKSAKQPIHLINYDADQEIFILEDTSASPLEIRGRFGYKYAYTSESDFVKTQLSEDHVARASSVCICDTPGMGKTFMLANIARLMAKSCTERIIVFIPLATFAADFYPSDTISPDTVLLNVLHYTISSPQNPNLLFNLVNENLLLLEIFFDGFDEIPSNKVECVKRVLKLITTHISRARIYVTSRPHMRYELQKSFGVRAFDILPFDQETQIKFLVEFWTQKAPNIDQDSLQTYASTCLEGVNNLLGRRDEEVTGIPLLCQLIAEVYANKLALKRTRFCDFPLKIPKMYQEFIELRINLVANNQEEFDRIKLAHIWHALSLLFPELRFHSCDHFKSFNQSSCLSQILKAGIIQKHSNLIQPVQFIHRTFAEYMLAEFLSTKLQDGEMHITKKSKSFSVSPLELLLNRNKYIYGNSSQHFFTHPGIISFADSILGGTDNSCNFKAQVSTFFTSLSPNVFVNMMRACCDRNFHNIFNIFMENVLQCEIKCVQEYFTTDFSIELLTLCIKLSRSEMFHNLIKLVTQILKLDLAYFPALLEWAVCRANYDAVEYLADQIPLKNPKLLGLCVKESYFESSDIVKTRENILRLLLKKDPSLMDDTPNVLAWPGINLKFIKMLVEFGAKQTGVNSYRENYAVVAAYYMSPIDYHDLITFILTDCKADFLFLPSDQWLNTLARINAYVELLPETFELLFKIPGIDVNSKNEQGNNLIFCGAVCGRKLGNLKKLVNHGLDYTAASEGNKNLLHMAVEVGSADIVQYLLSLNLDPNSCDLDKMTSLHYGVKTYSRTPLLLVKILVENGANVQAKTRSGQTPLHIASGYNHEIQLMEEVIKYLIGNGALVNDHDKDGNTPLHLCRTREMKECLVKWGADANAKNNKGETSAEKTPWLWNSS